MVVVNALSFCLIIWQSWLGDRKGIRPTEENMPSIPKFVGKSGGGKRRGMEHFYHCIIARCYSRYCNSLIS